MIDYFLRWNTEAEAKLDAQRLAAYLGTPVGASEFTWAVFRVLPNVQAWRPSQDVQNPDGTVTHTYIAGWMCILAMDETLQVILNDANLRFALDRDGPPYVIKNNIGAVLQDLAVSPIFAGSHYPLGGIN
jgi:hypothetical protein